MSDSCRGWRDLLTARSSGDIHAADRIALEEHLRECAGCRAAEEADSALLCVLHRPLSPLEPRRAAEFDARVEASLRAELAVPLSSPRVGGPRSWGAGIQAALPAGFLAQMAGGAMAAAAVTAFFLLSRSSR